MPIELRRYVLLGVLGLAVVFGTTLIMRPLIFSLGPLRDDSNYAVIETSQADLGPRSLTLLLNESHDLPGEVARGEHAELRVVVAPIPGRAGYTVIDAWSPTNDCAIELGDDRLVDCAGDAWTFGGIPIVASDPALQRFPVTVRDGGVIVDFTRPADAGTP